MVKWLWLTRSQELVLLEERKAILHSLVATLGDLVLNVAPEVLVHGGGVGFVHFVEVLRVAESYGGC